VNGDRASAPPAASSTEPEPLARRFVAWTLRHGRTLWAVAILLALPAAWRTAQLYQRLRGDVEELLPRQAPSVLAVDELRQRMPGLQYLGVVVDMGSAANAPAAQRFLADLAQRVRQYPAELQRGVYASDAEERAFLEAHAPLYVSLDDLRTLRARVAARRDYEVAKETGALLDEVPPPPLDFSDIAARYQNAMPKGGTGGGSYVSAPLATGVLLIEVGGFSTSAARGRHLLDRVKEDVRALDLVSYAPGMRVGYAGDVAISVEELSALVSDLSVSSVLVVALVLAVIALYYRWSRGIAALLLPLLLSAVYAFGLASLPPFGVTELNSNTAFLGSILIGNGINFGIVLLARYVEERRGARGVEDALAVAVSGSRAGTLTAALAACVSYGSLVLTQFRGFRQFGIIGGLGMILAWATAFLLMPPLLAWLDSSPRTAPTAHASGAGLESWTARLARGVVRVPRWVVFAGACAIALSVAEVSTFTADKNLETDMSHLRRSDTWTRGEGYWGRRMDAVLARYLTPTVILANDAAHARSIAGALREEAKSAPLSEEIQAIRTIDDVLPRDQEAKLEEVRALREEMTPRLRAAIADKDRALADRLLDSASLTTIGIHDLPHRLTTAMVERDGTYGRTVLVYPQKRQALWQGEGIEAFTRALRDASARAGGKVAGSLPLSADILQSIRHDGPRASLAAFLGVVAIVVVLFRWRVTTLFVLAALLTGVLWLAAGTMALGVKVNFANFIAFPITFGIGVDYSVNVVSRFLDDPERDVVRAVRSTGSAVLLCSLTTVIGYSSLLLAENRALRLFGVVAVLGEIACIVASLTLLPAVLAWVYGVRQGEGSAKGAEASVARL
jgi:hypothetical protein